MSRPAYTRVLANVKAQPSGDPLRNAMDREQESGMGVWKTVVALAMALVVAGPARAAEPDHGPWETLLARYVSESADGVNRVDYARWKATGADRAALQGYIRTLEAARPAQMARNEQFAYWANLYNAVTVEVILSRFPVDSIRNIRSEGAGLSLKALAGPWDTKLVTIEGRRMSLNDIEHGVMRPTFKDVRVHYAVNCASIGCPNLQREAFRAATLDQQLDAAARAYINHPRGVHADAGGLHLSSIYKWYAGDFGTPAQLRAHLERYAAPALAAQIARAPRIAGYDYDWRLNGTGAR